MSDENRYFITYKDNGSGNIIDKFTGSASGVLDWISRGFNNRMFELIGRDKLMKLVPGEYEYIDIYDEKNVAGVAVLIDNEAEIDYEASEEEPELQSQLEAVTELLEQSVEAIANVVDDKSTMISQKLTPKGTSKGRK